MAEADPPNPQSNSPLPASSGEDDRDPAEITAAAAAQLFAVGHALSGGARGAWQPPSVADLQRLLPQYEIRALLGRGGMGAVYRGMQRSLDREVAIKILPPEMAAEDAQFPERFQREGKAMARLNHPGIVTVFDAGETAEGLLYFVMEFVEGTDVQAMLTARGPLPAAEVLPIVAHVCEALEFAHSSGFIHRDIKPSNIMVDDRGRVKVADFGLARAMAVEGVGLTGDTMTICTAEFAAPEAFVPGETLDGRADIYSVGVMLYHLLTGEIPRGRFEGPSVRVAGLDPRIDGIVDRAMQADREHRYATARELRADILGVLNDVPAGRTGAGARNRWPLLGAGAAALVVIFTLAMIFRGRTRTDSPGLPLGKAPANSAASSAPDAAMPEQPFVNSLGMRFVPVPILGGPSGGQRVLFSVWETRVQDYAVFATETKAEWPPPGFAQGSTHPAVNVNWNDAQAFCAWLTERERKVGRLGAAERYRLPTDHEWSCAVGIGDREDPLKSPSEKSRKLADVFPWGSAFLPSGVGNYSGEEAAGHETWKEQAILKGYRDNFPETAPVGSFPANRFGLFDLGGNAWEWCEDLLKPAEKNRVLRGASFNNGGREALLSSSRDSHTPWSRSDNFGFRPVLAR